MPMSSAERQRAYINRLKAGLPTAAKHRKFIDRRSKPQRWDDAVGELSRLLDGYQEARDNLPDSLAQSIYAEKLDAILELRDLVETLSEAELPKGFGRD